MTCRTPCLNKKKFGDMAWDPSDWTALVEERKIVGWLVKQPDEREMTQM